jgi:hypothetical protein
MAVAIVEHQGVRFFTGSQTRYPMKAVLETRDI